MYACEPNKLPHKMGGRGGGEGVTKKNKKKILPSTSYQKRITKKEGIKQKLLKKRAFSIFMKTNAKENRTQLSVSTIIYFFFCKER